MYNTKYNDIDRSIYCLYTMTILWHNTSHGHLYCGIILVIVSLF